MISIFVFDIFEVIFLGTNSNPMRVSVEGVPMVYELVYTQDKLKSNSEVKISTLYT